MMILGTAVLYNRTMNRSSGPCGWRSDPGHKSGREMVATCCCCRAGCATLRCRAAAAARQDPSRLRVQSEGAWATRCAAAATWDTAMAATDTATDTAMLTTTTVATTTGTGTCGDRLAPVLVCTVMWRRADAPWPRVFAGTTRMATASTTTTPPRSTATGVTPTAHRQPRTARAQRTRSAPPPARRSASHVGDGCTIAGWLDCLYGDVTGARLPRLSAARTAAACTRATFTASAATPAPLDGAKVLDEGTPQLILL